MSHQSRAREKERAQQSERPWVAIGSDVVREIRKHARSSIKTEVCGVLVGHENSDGVEVEACISGLNAEQAGAHVTFTQDTWEHIYKVKDEQYPDQRIVGWYHSHPGFGIFLSDHDTFIHKNFFGSPRQVAWVCDPHSDEEGCFGWVGGRIERLTQIRIIDRQGGEAADIGERPEPVLVADARTESRDDNETPRGQRWQSEAGQSEASQRERGNSEMASLTRLAVTILSYLSVLILGIVIGSYFFPQIVVVPVNPITGQPMELRRAEPDRLGAAPAQDGQGTSSQRSSNPGKSNSGKGEQ
jgi:proteasome lid subunit RPN8/RPN11